LAAAADGKYAMAADLLESAETKFPASDSLKLAKRFAYLKFKFIIYSGKIGEETPQINMTKENTNGTSTPFVG
jgi:hypothetical protein